MTSPRAVAAGLAALSLLLPRPAAAQEAPGVQRVLLVTLDAVRADHLGALGGPVPTPSLDRLAREGVLVLGASTSIPVTGPGHASLMTGLYPWHHRTLENKVALDPRIPTLAEALGARGFVTAAFVSCNYLRKRAGFHQGFGTFVFEPTEPTFYGRKRKRRDDFWVRGEVTTSAAMGWITRHAAESFFVWVHLYDAAAPHEAPPGFAVSPADPVDLEGKKVRRPLKNKADLERIIRAYRGEVAYVDAQVGRLVDRLHLLGILDDTVVIVAADHGESLGDHGILQHQGGLYEGSVRVPLIVRGPGLRGGRRLPGAAQLEDIRPTLLSLLGAPEDPSLDGLDLSAWLRGEEEDSPRAEVVGRRAPGHGRDDQYYARSGTRKWIGPPDEPGIAFDLSSDPKERMPERGVAVPESVRRAAEAEGVPGVGSEAAPEPTPEGAHDVGAGDAAHSR